MKKYIIMLFFAALLILSGCSKEEKDSGLTSSFYGGTDGVSVEFKEIAPPQKFNQNQEIPVAVILKNKGEYEIVSGNAKAEIYGINHDTFSLLKGYKGTTGILRKKGELTAEGGEREISFGNLKYIEDVINSRTTEIRARVCYPYQTQTDIPICIKSSLSKEAGETVCSLDGEKVKEGTVSSAPIQVISVMEKSRGSNQVRFDITIENKGNGKVYENDATCEELNDDNININKRDKVLLEILNPTKVLCGFRSGEDSNRGIIDLDASSQRTISCWMDAEDTYTDTLKLTLSYMYTSTTSKQITIYEN